jgi:hypothetical protein
VGKNGSSRKPKMLGAALQLLVLKESRSKTEIMNSVQHLVGLYMSHETLQGLVRKAEQIITLLAAQHYVFRVPLGMTEEGRQEYEMRCAGCGGGSGMWPCRVLRQMQVLLEDREAPRG